MISFVEQAVKKFNEREEASKSIKSYFQKVSQVPNYDGGDDLFVKHLDKLNEKCAHFKRDSPAETIENQRHTEMDAGVLVEGVLVQ